MSVVAIIPARGGSKGLPQKNIKLCAGKPLLYWVAEAARQSKVFDRIVVSTDCKKIAKVAKNMSLEVQMRPQHLSGDEVGVTEILPYVIRHLGQEYDHTAILEPTGPLVEADDIQKAWHRLYIADADMVISVCPASAPLGFVASMPKGHSLTNWFPKHLRHVNRQDVPIRYQLDGNIYMAKTWVFDQQIDYWSTTIVPCILPSSKFVDIDDAEDFAIAEFKLKRRLHGA